MYEVLAEAEAVAVAVEDVEVAAAVFLIADFADDVDAFLLELGVEGVARCVDRMEVGVLQDDDPSKWEIALSCMLAMRVERRSMESWAQLRLRSDG